MHKISWLANLKPLSARRSEYKWLDKWLVWSQRIYIFRYSKSIRTRIISILPCDELRRVKITAIQSEPWNKRDILLMLWRILQRKLLSKQTKSLAKKYQQKWEKNNKERKNVIVHLVWVKEAESPGEAEDRDEGAGTLQPSQEPKEEEKIDLSALDLS